MLRAKMRWTFFADMLEDEFQQCIGEGRQVLHFREQIDAIMANPDENVRETAAKNLLLKMERAPMDATYSYVEPDAYSELLHSLSASSEQIWTVNQNTLKDKITGAWYGRAAGCVLGIPVEGWPRKKIRDFLEESGQLPVHGYLRATTNQKLREKYDVHKEDPTTPYDRQVVCWREYLNELPNDDDLNYTVLALKTLERYGFPLTSEKIAETWLLGIPPFHACTAERAAIRNLMEGILPPESAKQCNPYREWIGAQIRGDFYGYICPGQPKRAAQLAYVDGAVSHTKNGIYSEMYIAALISLCPVEGMSMLERVCRAMDQIPPKSRLYKSLEEVCQAFRSGVSFEGVVNGIHNRYDESKQFDWCLAIPNAMLVTACVLWAKSFDDAIGAAILCGFDTDCNGATVGSIMGFSHGLDSIASVWRETFPPVISTSIHGYSRIPIAELVDRTLHLARQINCHAI